jgi:uncharacterized membrane protein YccF (DUF307 family)
MATSGSGQPDGGSGSRRLWSAARLRVRASGPFLGYLWFMTLGTFLPLPIFLAGYVVHVTLVGAPLAWRIYGVATFMATFGQQPPGKDRLAARTQGKDKKPFVERIRPYSPPGLLERRGSPVAKWLRIVWFVLVGWWLGALWVGLAWSVLLLPYPLLEMIHALLGELPSVMTLAYPVQKQR